MLVNDEPSSNEPQNSVVQPIRSIPVLGYHGHTPLVIARHLMFKREGDVVTITVPAEPMAGRIVILSVSFLACGISTLGLLLSLARNFEPRTIPGTIPDSVPELAFSATAMLLLGWGTVNLLRRLLYVAREGWQESTLRISPDGISIKAQGSIRSTGFSIPRAGIAHLQLRRTLFRWTPAIWLEISTTDGALLLARLQWPKDEPTQRLEDYLRDLLGLSAGQLLKM